jgi:phage/plasmid-associated DNA primase
MKEFSNIVYNKDYLAFKNGSLNIQTMEFIKNEDINIDNQIIARHFINNDFNINNTDTPLMDSVIYYQLPNKEIVDIFYALIGRLFFDVKSDGWDVIPYIHGLPSTFKSGTLNVISACFRIGAIGSIGSTQEQIFGLDNLQDKELIIAPDCPENMADFLKEDIIKSMGSGELCNIPRKNKKASSMNWKTPTFMTGNYSFKYKDGGGALMKRIALYRFFNVVINENFDMQSLIIKNELPQFINKCLKLYHEYRNNHNSTFYNWAPEYFKENEHINNFETSPLLQFMSNIENKDKYGNIYRFNYNEKYETEYSKFQNWYQNWCKYTGIGTSKINDSILMKENLKIKNVHVCKSCRRKYEKGCCPKSNRNNRTTKKIITGVALEVIDFNGSVMSS